MLISALAAVALLFTVPGRPGRTVLAGKPLGPFTRGPKAQQRALAASTGNADALPGWARRAMRQLQKKIAVKQQALHAQTVDNSDRTLPLTAGVPAAVVPRWESDPLAQAGGAGMQTFGAQSFGHGKPGGEGVNMLGGGLAAAIAADLPGQGPGNATAANGQWGYWRTSFNSNNEQGRSGPIANDDPLGDHVVGRYLDRVVSLNASLAEQADENAGNPMIDLVTGKGLPKMFYEDDQFAPCPPDDPKCEVGMYGRKKERRDHRPSWDKVDPPKKTDIRKFLRDRHRINCTDPSSTSYSPLCEKAIDRTHDPYYKLPGLPAWRIPRIREQHGWVNLDKTMKVPYPGTGYYGGRVGPPFNTEGIVGSEGPSGLFSPKLGAVQLDRQVPAQAQVGHVRRPVGDEVTHATAGQWGHGVLGGGWDQEMFLPVPPESYFEAQAKRDTQLARADRAPPPPPPPPAQAEAPQTRPAAPHGRRAPRGGAAGARGSSAARQARAAGPGGGARGARGQGGGEDLLDPAQAARGDVPLERAVSDVEGWLAPVRRAAQRVEATRAGLRSAGRAVAAMKHSMETWRARLRRAQLAAYPTGAAGSPFARERRARDYGKLLAEDAEAAGAGAVAPPAAGQAGAAHGGDGAAARVGSWLKGLLGSVERRGTR
jgi:hypothetical protein